MAADMIPPAKPFIPKEDIEELKGDLEKILSSGMLTLGQYTKAFEEQFRNFVHAKYAVAVNSGSSALEIALRTHNLKRGDEVIVPTNTFGATAASVVFAGARPVITDVSSRTMTLDSSIVKRAITKRTKGVLAVHIGGMICPDIAGIKEICDKRDLFLVEDAAHAHGSRIDGEMAGTLGSAGCFSFYPTKVMTSGEGGMITTDNEEIAKNAGVLRDQGKENFNSSRIIKLGFNWRMPEICAALGILQLRRLPDFIERRNKIARMYDDAVDKLGLERVVTPPNHINNYYKYTFFMPKNVDRDKFKALCRNQGVAYGGEVYWPPLHLQPAFKRFLDKKAHFSVAEDWCSRMVNPPVFSQMTTDQVQRVIQVTTQTITELRK
jgi:dTDP-4-amino-4,6-dideoxygalactose transaminase